MSIIDSFKGEYRWLSNFWPAEVVLDGVTYPTVEHAYVAAKTLNPESRRIVLSMDTPGKVKRFGSNLMLRADWNDVRLSVMEDLVRQKFKRRDLEQQLLATSPAILIEGNTWGDTFWGMCRGKGENHLGKILMNVRGEIWEASQKHFHETLNKEEGQ